jgi:hypothetical protein
MSRQAELFRRACDCERLLTRLGLSPEARHVLKQLRDFWIALANESELGIVPDKSIDREIAAMEKILADYKAGIALKACNRRPPLAACFISAPGLARSDLLSLSRLAPSGPNRKSSARSEQYRS